MLALGAKTLNVVAVAGITVYYQYNMRHEAVQGHDLAPEVATQTSEASPFADTGHAALILQFYETGADPTIGRELSVRLLAHAGYAGDPTAEPLTGNDGRRVLDTATGRPLVLADYVNYATNHHIYALEDILNFLHTKPGEPDYERGRAAYAGYLEVNQSQTGRS
jgi:hypothetical protein